MSRILNSTLSAAVALLFLTGTHLMAVDPHAGHHHDNMMALGTVTLGSITAKVEGAGVPVVGRGWHVTVDVPVGTPAPKAIRVWVGIENGRGSEKAKAELEAKHPGRHSTHVNVPAPLPEGSKLWVSLENAAGEITTTSVALPAAQK
jgi:hypothetical protein